MNNERTTIGWGFWIVWVLASVIGFGIGSFIGIGVSYALLPAVGITEEFGIAHLIMFGTMLGIASGFLQWVVLRGKVAQAGWWIAVSAAGFAIAGGTLGTIGVEENYLMAGILFLVVFGVAGGILQGLVLKKARIARVDVWVLANIFGSLVGAIGIPAAQAVSTATGHYGLSSMVFGVLIGAGLGAIPGAALVWLLRQSYSSNMEGVAAAH